MSAFRGRNHIRAFLILKVIVPAICVLSLPWARADATAAAEPVGRDVIEQMSIAMQNLTYDGTFVYIQGSNVETMRIYHSRIDGAEHERLSSLNGEAREIIRDASSVTCIWPGTKSVIVSDAAPRSPFPKFETEQLEELGKYYQFILLGSERVAGRAATIIDIKPLDQYRYGYRLWVDSETSLLLRSAMSDMQGHIVEQVMYTSINYRNHVPLEMFRASIDGDEYRWETRAAAQLASVADSAMPVIESMSLPNGFIMVTDELTPVTSEISARRMMYSDGLASLSVFLSDTAEEALRGGSSMGAVNAYGVDLDRWNITVIGEVPMKTVQMLGDSIKLVAN